MDEKAQQFHIDGVQSVKPAKALELIREGAVLLDVREAFEIADKAYDIGGVVCIPISEIADRFQELPKEKTIVVGSALGIRSTKIANLLNYQGYSNVVSIDGGLLEWEKEGLPVTDNQTEFKAHHEGGCSCCGKC